MRKVKEKNSFHLKDLSYFDGKKSLITIEDNSVTTYKTILVMGSVLFIIGLGLFFFGDSDFGVFFLFISTVFFLVRGLYHYLVYLKYKDIPLTLHLSILKYRFLMMLLQQKSLKMATVSIEENLFGHLF